VDARRFRVEGGRAMAEFGKAAQVGLMVIALGGAAYVGYRFVSPTTGTSGGYTVHAYLPDVTGVAPHSRVTISGIQTGVVDRIWLDQNRARVDVKMKPDVKLYDDAVIGKRASSLIGESFIVLTPGTEGHRVLKDGDEITHVLDEPSIQTLENQVSDILKDVKGVTESLRGSVGTQTGQEQIAAILKNLAEVTEQLNQAVKENREAVRESLANIQTITRESQPKIDSILVNVKQITDEVRRATASAEAPGQGGKAGDIKSALERINRASASLESTLQHADNIAARVDKGQGTVGRLTKDETLVNEVEGVVEDVGDFVGGISRLQTVVGLRTDYNFLANTVKSYVELRLQPAEDKYYLIELVNDPRGKTSVEQTDVDTTNPAFPPHYRETRTTTTNAFRFSFQFAKRMGPFTGRFGIKESTGGFGLDLHLLDDRFELNQDIFGFGEELTPRWRVALAYEFIRKLWLVGGVDDIFSHDRRDYFVGLQLRFTDHDLKTILPFASMPK
jgi:phospholipid/cholesterol/gamma-HCH transport system substrate-binding protein